MSGFLICILFIAGYYGLMIFCLRFCNVDFVKIFREECGKILILCAAVSAFMFWQVSMQKWIYTWDFLETWEPVIICEQVVFSDPVQSLINLRNSINYADYNNFLPMLMVLPLHLFGKSFLAYTMYVWVMFALPTLLLTAAAIKASVKNFYDENISCATILLILFLIPLMEIPVLNGYANVSILFPAIILWLMLLSLDKEKLQPIRLFLISVLSILAVIQSRSAAYMVIGIFFGYAVYEMHLGYVEKNLRGKVFMLAKKFCLIGLFGAVIMLTLFFPFVERILTYDHGTAYSAYSVGYSLPIKILGNVLIGGTAIYLIFFAGIFAGLRSKKFRPITIFSIAWLAATVILICRIQFMAMQHYYTMLTPFCAVVVVTIFAALKHSKFIGGIAIFLLIFNLMQAYIDFFAYKVNSVTININYAPPIRNDIDDLKNFIGELNEMTEGDKKIYLIASSGVYNYTVFQKIYMPEKALAMPNLIPTADVDLRDGFPIPFFDADIVIVSVPAHTHLRPQDQSVVWRLSEIVTSMPLARHFKFIKEISLYPTDKVSDSVTLKVYKKISPYDKSDIDFVENFFVNLYPDSPALFKDRFEKYKLEKFNE